MMTNFQKNNKNIVDNVFLLGYIAVIEIIYILYICLNSCNVG